MALDKINTAVRSILESCREAANPLLSLQASMNDLRQSGRWSARELGEVRTAVLEILNSASPASGS
jgi:hypothetical protein